MGLMDVLADLIPSLSVTDVPGGRSIFGPLEPLIALGAPFVGDDQPSEEEMMDGLVDAGGAAAPVGSGGLAGPVMSEGKKNIRNYNSRKRRKADEALSHIPHKKIQKPD